MSITWKVGGIHRQKCSRAGKHRGKQGLQMARIVDILDLMCKGRSMKQGNFSHGIKVQIGPPLRQSIAAEPL